jgi:phosphotriesterase-related protein
MTELFVREIREGIGETGVRAGMLKCATDRAGITPGVERVLRAVAQAHRQTGVPITTHTPTPPQPWGLEQQRILAEEGVDLGQVVIGHSGGTLDAEYHQAIIANGSYVGFDHFGIGTFSMAERIESVKVLCQRGLADRIVLSHDAMCHVDWFPPALASGWKDWRWTHIPEDVLPEMRRSGISEDDISTMMVDNPRRILEGCAPY